MTEREIQELARASEKPHRPWLRVSRKQYEGWRRQAVLDMLQGLRYGQSFCNRFCIADHFLAFCTDPASADRYIQHVYMRTKSLL